MSLSASSRRNDYLGSNSNTNFDFNFRIDDESHLEVKVLSDAKVKSDLVIDVDYTLAGVSSSTGGSITLLDAGQSWIHGDGGLKSGYTIHLVGATPQTQVKDIRNQGPRFPQTLEQAFDKLTMQVQEIEGRLSASIHVADTVNPSTLSMEISAADLVDAGGKTIIINDDADGISLGPSLQEYIDAATGAEAAQAAAEAAADEAAASEAAAEQSASDAASYSITPVEFSFTNAQDATAVEGESYSSAAKRAVFYEMFVVRGALIAVYKFIVAFNGTQFYLINQGFDGDDCGLTWEITGTTTFALTLASTDAAVGGDVYGKKRFINT